MIMTFGIFHTPLVYEGVWKNAQSRNSFSKSLRLKRPRNFFFRIARKNLNFLKTSNKILEAPETFWSHKIAQTYLSLLEYSAYFFCQNFLSESDHRLPLSLTSCH